jgi:stage IV sporulation protein FB
VLVKFKINKYFFILLFTSLISGYTIEILLLFLFVLLHESCHAFLAAVYGLKIGSIEIFPFGGVARIDNLESVGPVKEIIISAAGPILNVFIAFSMFLLDRAGVYIPMKEYILDINITLALFNMLPGLPLDGGRIMRAALSYFTSFRKATKAAVVSGKITASLVFAWGLFAVIYGNVNYSLLIVPVFVFISAGREEKTIMYTIIKNMVSKRINMTKRGVMDSLIICACEDICIKDLLKYFDLDKYHIIIVLDSHLQMRAQLTESQIFDTISVYGSGATLGQICDKYDK